MKKSQREADRSTAEDLHRIVSTSLSIFDSTFALLSPQSPGSFVPGPGHLACTKNVLQSLGIEKVKDSILV